MYFCVSYSISVNSGQPDIHTFMWEVIIPKQWDA